METRPLLTTVLGLCLSLALLFCGETLRADGLRPMSTELKNEAVDYIQVSLRRTIEDAGDRFPVASEGGVWELNEGGWTGGYLAGMLWLMFEETGDQFWRRMAEKYTWLLEGYKDNVDMSDVGILFWPSFDLGYSIIKDSRFREVGLEGARSLMQRYIPAAGYIQNWGRLGEKGQMGFVIIDCLINLDHLYWAAEETGEVAFSRAATSHAERTRVSHVRPDYSSFQVVEFNPETGEMIRGFTKQGKSDDSTWSRGQSWGIYGFTRVYRHSRERRFLETATRMADWFIERLPSDFVPYWDFSAAVNPDVPRDSSAAAMAASGLLELSRYVENRDKAKHYHGTAGKILASLAQNYLTRDLRGRNDGVLSRGTYFYRIGRSVDQASIWGDFYFLEALIRWSKDRGERR